MNRSTTLALVDDHPIVAIGVRAMLESEANIQFVHHSDCAQSILTFYAEYNTDLLLLDLNLPDMDYLDLIKDLKRHATATKIIAYTAYNTPSLVKTVIRLGLDGYLLKTTSPSEFRHALQRVLASKDVYIGESVQLNQNPQPKFSRLKDNFQKRLSLSKREKEILALISQGCTSQTISTRLFISKYTVETHRKNILRKLNFNSSTELVKFAVQQGLV